jgi:hypothetical protein
LKTLVFCHRAVFLIEADGLSGFYVLIVRFARHGREIATFVGSIGGNNGLSRPYTLGRVGGVDLFVDGLGYGFGEPGEAEQGFE